ATARNIFTRVQRLVTIDDECLKYAREGTSLMCQIEREGPGSKMEGGRTRISAPSGTPEFIFAGPLALETLYFCLSLASLLFLSLSHGPRQEVKCFASCPCSVSSCTLAHQGDITAHSHFAPSARVAD
ncbi:unnamed protein product, partial [Mycena citricolor]